MLEQPAPEGLYSMEGDPQWRRLWRTVSCGRVPMQEQGKDSSS